MIPRAAERAKALRAAAMGACEALARRAAAALPALGTTRGAVIAHDILVGGLRNVLTDPGWPALLAPLAKDRRLGPVVQAYSKQVSSCSNTSRRRPSRSHLRAGRRRYCNA